VNLVGLGRQELDLVALLLVHELELACLFAVDGVAEVHVLESFLFPDVVVVGDIDCVAAVVRSKANYLKSREVGRHELLLFLLLWPRQLRNDSLRVLHQLLEHLALLLVHYRHPGLVVGARVLRVEVSLYPSLVAFNVGSFVCNPLALRIFVSFYRSSRVRLYVEFMHLSLILVCTERQNKLKLLNQI